MQTTINRIQFDDESKQIITQDVKFCEVMIDNKSYIVPLAVAKVLGDLAGLVQFEQNRRIADNEKIKDMVKNYCGRIANALAGGYMGRYGKNLLAMPLTAKVPLPPGLENDDGSKETEFISLVSRRIYSCLSGEEGLEKKFNPTFEQSR